MMAATDRQAEGLALLLPLEELARQAQGRSADARQAYHEALVVIESVAAGLSDASLRETFLGSPHVEHIRRLARSGHAGRRSRTSARATQ